jgi:hypothetical protein
MNALRFAVCCTLCLACCSSEAADPSAELREASIEIGQPLADVRALLTKRNLTFGNNGFALHIPNDDDANIFAVLDEEHATAAIFYSKSKQRITAISIEFYPDRKAVRNQRFWLSAKAIELKEDGSYNIHFSPPRKAEDAPQRQNVLPSSKP